METDGLLAAGEPGVQLTWMDAKVGDWVVTPRIGKPVEVQALWLNALRIGGLFEARFLEAFERGRRAFASASGTRRRAASTTWWTTVTRPVPCDDSFRPNQIFAVGGLPFAAAGGARGRVPSWTRSRNGC